MPTPAEHYAEAEALLEEAAELRDEANDERDADPKPTPSLRSPDGVRVDPVALREWQDRRSERVGRLVEADRLVTAAQAHATLAAIPQDGGGLDVAGRQLTADEAGRLLEVFQSLTEWAASRTVAPRPGSELYHRGHRDGTDEAKATVRRLLDRARGVLAR